MYSRHLNDPLTCLVAYKASKESFHFSRWAAVVFTSSHDCHPAFALSFSTVLLRVVFGTHDVYVSTGHFSRYLRNVTTSVQCMYIPVFDLPDIFGVYRLPMQFGGVLLPLTPTHHRIAPILRTGHSVPLIKWIFSACGFCNDRVIQERAISPHPNPQLEGLLMYFIK